MAAIRGCVGDLIASALSPPLLMDESLLYYVTVYMGTSDGDESPTPPLPTTTSLPPQTWPPPSPTLRLSPPLPTQPPGTPPSQNVTAQLPRRPSNVVATVTAIWSSLGQSTSLVMSGTTSPLSHLSTLWSCLRAAPINALDADPSSLPGNTPASAPSLATAASSSRGSTTCGSTHRPCTPTGPSRTKR